MHKSIAVSLLGLSHQSITGGFVYTENLLKKLLPLDKDNSYFLITSLKNYNYFKNLYGKYPNVTLTIVDPRVDSIRNPLRATQKIIAKIRKDNDRLEDIITKEVQYFINKKKIDLFFFPTAIIYPRNLTNTKIVTTVYDLQHKYFPENFSQKMIEYKESTYKYAADHSDHLLSISNYTRKTYIDEYNVDPKRITTTHLGPHGSENETHIELPKQYIFYPAAFWPHKNHKILIETLGKLKNTFPELELVFTGIVKKKRIQEELSEIIEKYNVESEVHFLGFVTDEELTYIHKHASLLAFPSSFEGFGMPVIEAFKYGIPVIASNNSSLTEVVGDAGILVETNNLEQLVRGIKKVLTDSDCRDNLIKKGKDREKLFLWENTAKETLSVFNSM